MSSLLHLSVLLCCWLTVTWSHLLNNPELDHIWDEFKKQHSRRFTDKDHELKRRHIFEDHLEMIHEHNLQADLGKHSYRMGITPFSDWSVEEFKEFLNIRHGDKNGHDEEPPTVQMVTSSYTPDTVNWVAKGAVTPVKNQGSCGCCYSFSATGALEGQMFLKTGKLVSLSVQNILDCSASQGNQGCNGGAIPYSFRYVQIAHGLDTEAAYPYTGKVGQCIYNQASSAASCSGYHSLPSGDESSLQQAVASVGPVSVAIDASTLQFYRSGVYSSSKCSSTNLNHAVLVVGYGTSSSGQQFWQVKNSWGTSWGMSGYIEIARNAGNMCGIATAAVYPTV